MKAMKIFLSSLGLAGLLMSFGCGGGASAEFEKFVNQICECKDMKCVEDKQKEWAKKGAEMAKDMKPEDAAEMAKKMEPLTKKMTECVEKIAKNAAGGGDEKKE